ncbi:sugar phosphate isomerase/epimerase family protein [Jeotgalibaca caeni]|uniref:sugar phosphate isomerase/epimerase family protein n=1 Tax=Jeotgalibaca caeni TaxID=3028623 RepID=UPI00237E2FAF|nr:TIM barrel protein [Jeotgalibaca caeni]MDE1549288.1 TIM barrel protein [Jeotgalibaca caeni]
MKNIGICSVTFRKKSPEEIIKLAQKGGLHAIEWGGDIHVPINDLENAKKIGVLTRQAGLLVSSYGSYYYAGQGLSFEPFLETAIALGTTSIRIWAKKMDFKKEIGVIDEEEFAAVVHDIKTAAMMAQAHDVSLHIEFHQGTYTDTTESALRLMKEIDEPNLFLYWQPLAYTSQVERLNQIIELSDFISNVHVFQWDRDFNRYPLAEGQAEWRDYIQQIQTHSSHPHFFLLEFMKDNSVEQFEEDVVTFHKLFD